MTENEQNDRSHSPIFVVGAARSGTTLTYSLLLSSGAFPIYEAESRILECASRYGPLSSRRNRERFLSDFLRSRQFARSELSQSHVENIAAKRSASYVDFLDGFMAAIAHSQGKTRWVEKSPNNVNFVGELARHYPNARFLHIVRDGRAVSISQRKLGWGGKYSKKPRQQLIWIANVWDLQVAAGRSAASFGGRYLEIRYEDLILRTEATLRRIEQFADVDLDPAVTQEPGIGALRSSNSAFPTGQGGISKRAVGHWRSILTPRELGLLEWQIGGRLRELGYPTRDVPASRPPLSDRILAHASRRALQIRHDLNINSPLGRIARKPLEIGLT